VIYNQYLTTAGLIAGLNRIKNKIIH